MRGGKLSKKGVKELLGYLPGCERFDSGAGDTCGKPAMRYRKQNGMLLCDDCGRSHHPDTGWAKTVRALKAMVGL